jgi:hypothetical protein
MPQIKEGRRDCMHTRSSLVGLIEHDNHIQAGHKPKGVRKPKCFIP